MSTVRVSCALLVSVIAIVIAIAAGPPSIAQSVSRRGDELQANSHTTNTQRTPAVAVHGDGDFVLVWASEYQDGDDNGIFARAFDALGAPLTSEFQVNSYTVGDQRYPAVAIDGNGDFVVVWSSNGQDGSSYGIFSRHFGSGGTPLGPELQVNSHTADGQGRPSVAIDGNGDFVVVWQSLNQDGENFGVFARRFDAGGAAQGSEFRVNIRTALGQSYPAVSLESDGDFIVVWESAGQDGHAAGVFARRFDAAGTALASEFQVNTYTMSSQSRPDVAHDDDSDFVVTWQSYHDGSNYGVFARRFDSAGAAQASEFQVNSRTALNQRFPDVAAEDDGDFVVIWTTYGQDGPDSGIFARHFDSAGAPLTSELQINSYTTSFQRNGQIATAGSGSFVVAWDSLEQDGSSEGVFAQRLGAPAVLDIDGDGSVTALGDGILVLRFLFDFSGGLLTSGAVDDDCTRCDAQEIEDYLETLI